MSCGVRKGVSELKKYLNSYLINLKEEGVENITVLVEFTQNKFDNSFHDIHLKNAYYTLDSNLNRLIDFKGVKIYSCFKLKTKREFAAIDFDGANLSINEDLTTKIVSKEIKGKYGQFITLFTPIDDYEEL